MSDKPLWRPPKPEGSDIPTYAQLIAEGSLVPIPHAVSQAAGLDLDVVLGGEVWHLLMDGLSADRWPYDPTADLGAELTRRVTPVLRAAVPVAERQRVDDETFSVPGLTWRLVLHVGPDGNNDPVYKIFVHED
ncbi:hypothetical protein ACF09H_29570 [Streptomyces sp. NPDC014983]|uniref:hypothetical protein n=1 Tax=Streptomyces sp. NPDC014983 TaxID=3364933 RepID=UPI0036FC0FE0